MPGSRLLEFARLWFSPAVVATVFEPLIADWQRQWIDAPSSRRTQIWISGAAAFARAALLCSSAVLFTVPPTAMARRVLARLIILTAVASVPFLIPYWLELRGLRADVAIPLAMWIIPSAVAAALPFTFGFSTDSIRHSNAMPAPASRAMSLQLAAVAVLGIVVLQGWVVPAANQRYRTGMVRHEAFTALSLDATGEPPRGIGELTTFELAREFAAAPTSAHPQARANMLARALYARIAFPVLAVVMIWLRWRATAPSKWHWPTSITTPIALVLFGATYFTLGAVLDFVLGGGPALGAWGPIAIFLLFGWFRGRSSRRSTLRTETA